MRVTHLTDDEVQNYLDRWQPRSGKLERRQLDAGDVETLQHLDHCPDCQEQLFSYRRLYQELNEPLEARLPRSFARRVTWSLPPFAAMRTRQRLKAAISTGFVGLLVMVWLFARIDWPLLIGQTLAWTAEKVAIAEFWSGVLWNLIPTPRGGWPDLTAWWLHLSGAVERVLSVNIGLIHLAVMACLAALLVESADRFLLRAPGRFHRR